MFRSQSTIVGVGSNPTPDNLFFFFFLCVCNTSLLHILKIGLCSLGGDLLFDVGHKLTLLYNTLSNMFSPKEE